MRKGMKDSWSTFAHLRNLELSWCRTSQPHGRDSTQAKTSMWKIKRGDKTEFLKQGERVMDPQVCKQDPDSIQAEEQV